MSVSKRLRFEVFKRDLFTCMYCGRKPPTVVLEADHIAPESGGGAATMENLVTACFDCNRGKADKSLGDVPSPLVNSIEQVKEREEQILAYQQLMKEIQLRINFESLEVDDIFQSYFPGQELSNLFMEGTLKVQFLKALPVNEVKESMHKACGKLRYSSHRAIKYFCGICWTKIRGSR